MADGSDDPHADRRSSRAWSSGASSWRPASRYMQGGQQIGGAVPEVDAVARGPGLSLYWFARVGTHDATNSFKAYDRAFVQEVGIDSDAGFEVGIELVAKARRHRRPVAEIPTIWLERTQGESNFKVRKWLPGYLRWYSLRIRTEDHRVADAGANNMSKIVVSGSAGFIGGYVVQELLARGHEVVGIDNHSKYGPVAHTYDDDPGYRFVEGDARDVDLMTELLADCDHFVAGAAMIGGISYFHTYAYDLLATNERIIAVVVRRGHHRRSTTADSRRSPT